MADEVRKLAERTQKSLVEINTTVNIIAQATSSASEYMSSNSKDINELAFISTEVERKINTAATIVNQATNASDKIVKDFENTGTDVGTIAKSINEINFISTENARNVEEIASAAEHLNNMTSELSEKLKHFKT